MSAQRILIVYATSHGHTEKVARYMADLLAEAGVAVTLANADAIPSGVVPRNFDGIVVGSPILFGRHRRSVARLVRTHRDALNALPSAFVSVSGSAASPLPAEREKAQQCVDQFLRETGWRPGLTEVVGGAMS
jgi:menaquinone-dependent protoporphyrinogen oxidase